MCKLSVGRRNATLCFIRYVASASGSAAPLPLKIAPIRTTDCMRDIHQRAWCLPSVSPLFYQPHGGRWSSIHLWKWSAVSSPVAITSLWREPHGRLIGKVYWTAICSKGRLPVTVNRTV